MLKGELQTDFIKDIVVDSGWYDSWKVIEDKYNELKAQFVEGDFNQINIKSSNFFHILISNYSVDMINNTILYSIVIIIYY